MTTPIDETVVQAVEPVVENKRGCRDRFGFGAAARRGLGGPADQGRAEGGYPAVGRGRAAAAADQDPADRRQRRVRSGVGSGNAPAHAGTTSNTPSTPATSPSRSPSPSQISPVLRRCRRPGRRHQADAPGRGRQDRPERPRPAHPAAQRDRGHQEPADDTRGTTGQPPPDDHDDRLDDGPGRSRSLTARTKLVRSCSCA